MLSNERHWQQLTSENVAQNLGIPLSALPAYVDLKQYLDELQWRRPNQSERDGDFLTTLKELERDDLITVGDNDASRWERGWGEVLESIQQQGFSPDLLRPQYFKYDVVRYLGDYAHVSDRTFEYRLYQAYKALIFARYLPPDCETVIEFGCGTGSNLLQLSEQFPKTQFVGCDWAKPSQVLIALMAEATGRPLAGARFNMLTLEGRESIPLGSSSAVLTLHAMEQLGSNWKLLLDYWLATRPRICIHIEPIVELYAEDNLFDHVAIRYHKKRNYLTGYLPELRRLAASKVIELIEVRRLGLGSMFQEGYSLIVWRPIQG